MLLESASQRELPAWYPSPVEVFAVLCSDQLSPKAVEALKDRRVIAIAGGWRHTAAADDAGNLYTWGWNKVRWSRCV